MHRRCQPLILLLSCFAFGLLSAPGLPLLRAAQAQPHRAAQPPLETDPRLGPIYSRGVEAMLAGRQDEALTTFEDLYRQSPRPTLLYYLGKVAQGQGRGAAAFDLFRRFLKGSGEEIDADTRLEVQQFLAGISPPDCEVAVTGEAGALLSVDGRIAGTLPLDQSLALSPGPHRLLLAHGRRKVETQINLLARRRAEVRFTLVSALALLTLTPAVLLLPELDPRAIEPSLSVPLQTALREMLAQQNAVLIAPEQQAELLQRNPDLLGCIEQTTCQEKLAQLSHAQFVLRLHIKAESMAAGAAPGAPAATGFRFAAKLLDADVGQVSVQATQTCPDCNSRRAIAQISDVVQELFRQASSRPRGTLEIDSDVPGALVQVDGRTLGTTPYRRDTFVGPHEILVSKTGHVPFTTNVQLGDGETVKVSAGLPQSTPPVQPYARARRIAKWSLLGGGVVATVLGATLLGINASRPLCTGASGGLSTPMGCSTTDLRPAGATLFVLGAGALIGSGVLFLMDRPSAAAAAPAAAPSPDTQPQAAPSAHAAPVGSLATLQF